MLNLLDIVLPLYLILFVLWIFSRPAFVKDFALKKDDFYLLSFTQADKIIAILTLLTWLLLLNSDKMHVTTISDFMLKIVLFIFICLFSLYLIFTKVIFNEHNIEIHNFWRPKQTILWKDVKKLTYNNESRQSIIIETKNNIKYKISNNLSGLATFISQYKIRNKK